MIVYRTVAFEEYLNLCKGNLNAICTRVYYRTGCQSNTHKYEGKRYIHFFKSYEMAEVWKKYRGLKNPEILRFNIPSEVLTKYQAEGFDYGTTDIAQIEYAIPMDEFDISWFKSQLHDCSIENAYNNKGIPSWETTSNLSKTSEITKSGLNLARVIKDKQENLKRFKTEIKSNSIKIKLKEQRNLPKKSFKHIHYKTIGF